MAVLTSSGTLVSLLFGLVAVISQGDGFTLPTPAKGPLYVGLIFFTFAAVAGLMCGLPLWGYKNVDDRVIVKTFRNNIRNLNDDKSEFAIADSYAQVYSAAARMNGAKSWVLFAAMALEVIAVVAVAISVYEIIKHS